MRGKPINIFFPPALLEAIDEQVQDRSTRYRKATRSSVVRELLEDAIVARQRRETEDE